MSGLDGRYGPGVLGTVAAADIGLQTLAAILSVNGELVLPVVALLAADFSLKLGTVGWFIGWSFLAIVAVSIIPIIYPEDLSGWTSKLAVRLLLGGAAVGAGIVIEQLVLAALEWGTPVLQPPTKIVIGLPVAVAGLFTLSGLLPIRPVGNPEQRRPFLLSSRNLTELSTAATVFRGSLTLLILGGLLAEASLLYPLPELFLVSVVVLDLIAVRLFDRQERSLVSDAAERIAHGARGAWGELPGVLILVYATGFLFGLILILLFVFGGQIDLLTRVTRRPVNTLYALLLLGGLSMFVLRQMSAYLHRVPSIVSAGDGEFMSPITPTQPNWAVLGLVPIIPALELGESLGSSHELVDWVLLFGTLASMGLVLAVTPGGMPTSERRHSDSGIRDDRALIGAVVVAGFLAIVTEEVFTVATGASGVGELGATVVAGGIFVLMLLFPLSAVRIIFWVGRRLDTGESDSVPWLEVGHFFFAGFLTLEVLRTLDIVEVGLLPRLLLGVPAGLVTLAALLFVPAVVLTALTWFKQILGELLAAISSRLR